jgi:hypothetical protein
MKQTTDTNSNFLVPESNYEAMINKIVRKEIKEFIIYEWHFEALVNEKPFYFKIGMFSSQMADLLRALGCTEVSKGKFDWDDEEQIGKTISFTVAHVADKKGVLREVLSDIKLLTASTNPGGVKSPSDIAWND